MPTLSTLSFVLILLLAPTANDEKNHRFQAFPLGQFATTEACTKGMTELAAKVTTNKDGLHMVCLDMKTKTIAARYNLPKEWGTPKQDPTPPTNPNNE